VVNLDIAVWHCYIHELPLIIMNKTTIIIIGLVLIAGSFYAGIKYNGDTTPAAQPNGADAGSGTRLGERGQSGSNSGGFTAGEIIAKDEKSITIKLRVSGSKIVFLTSATPVTKSVDGSISDLTVGTQVSVSGTANTDGSVSAQSVQIRPAFINNLSTNSSSN